MVKYSSARRTKEIAWNGKCEEMWREERKKYEGNKESNIYIYRERGKEKGK